MAIDPIVAMVILGFNLGLTLMPFLLSWSLTLNVSTFFLIVANISLGSPLNPLQFFASWGTSLLGTIQACVFLRGTINPSRMLTVWHYDSEPLHGHLRNQYFEIAARGFVAVIYIAEGILFTIEEIRTVAFIAIRISVNIIILIGLFIYFHIVFRRPTVAQFYLAMILTSCAADLSVLIIASAVGSHATGAMLAAFFGVHVAAAVVTLLVTAIYGSAYNRYRVQGNEQSGSERLYPIFHDNQLYAPSLWLYMPAWFRSSPHPIEYTDDSAPSRAGSIAAEASFYSKNSDDDSYSALYDVSAIESELEDTSTSVFSEHPINLSSTPPLPSTDVTPAHSPTPSLQATPTKSVRFAPRTNNTTYRFVPRHTRRGKTK